MTTFELIGTIAASIFGSQVLATIASGFFAKKKTNADAASLLVEKMLDWQTSLTARIVSLEQMLREKDTLIDQLQVRVGQLEIEVAKLENHK